MYKRTVDLMNKDLFPRDSKYKSKKDHLNKDKLQIKKDLTDEQIIRNVSKLMQN